MSRLSLAGETLVLDASGVLVWPRAGLLAVADLHLEKGSACARQGNLVPPWDSAVTVERLRDAVVRHRPAIVVSVGDGFHDSAGSGRLGEAEARALRAIGAQARLIWVCGNHDPCGPDGLGGETHAAFQLGPLTFRHEARPRAQSGAQPGAQPGAQSGAQSGGHSGGQPGAMGEISGHYHPKARVQTRAGDVTRPCFLADSARLILPAFGAYTGGLDVTSPALARLFPDGATAYLLGRDKLFRFNVPAPARRGGAARVAATGVPMA